MDKILKCLIVEDNPTSIELLQNYLNKLNLFATTTVCSTYSQAIQALSFHKFDLLSKNTKNQHSNPR